jgi:hypothetical protein
MRVTEGTSYTLSDGTWQKPEVTLEEVDFERVVVEWGISAGQIVGMTTIFKYQILSVMARQMLFSHQVSQRRHDDHWVSSEKPEIERALRDELRELFGKAQALPG